jgi:hypothetical protein
VTSDELEVLIYRLRTAGESEGCMALIGMATCTQAADALEAGRPSETAGRCSCGICEYLIGNDDGVAEDQGERDLREGERRDWTCDETYWPVCKVGWADMRRCPGCGDRLRSDGVSERNADAGRVERMRAELARLDAKTETKHISEFAEHYWDGAVAVCKRIRAALDGGVADETHGPRKPSDLEIIRCAADAFRAAANDLRQALMNLCLLPADDREEIALRAVEIIGSDEWEMHVCGMIADRIAALGGGAPDAKDD